ncbi:hypothetical protein ACHHYP_08231 [Achlya hypogyna]|uniref:Uncharacterized protein n=1 Tax=Achlya hypogyna TaxID=1202772 RepID=A0A1V9ZL53_ACHHY|nr:hypothetical protein ACHHYP_08231 [Achlya hypogyna]
MEWGGDEPDAAALQQQIQCIPLLLPWTRIDVANTMLCRESDSHWNEPLRAELSREIADIYARLLIKTRMMNTHSMLSTAANETRLHGRLLVEVQRRVSVPDTLERVKANAAKPPSREHTAQQDFETTLRFRRQRTVAAESAPRTPAKPLPHSRSCMSPKKSLQVVRSMTKLTSALRDGTPELVTESLPAKSKDGVPTLNKASPDGSNVKPESTALFIQFPKHRADLRELVEASVGLEPSPTHFRDRPLLASAILDAGVPLPKRDPATLPPPRPRYLMKEENRTALPHTKTIFDDYVVPREVWDAVEAERSLRTIKTDTTGNFEPVALDDIQMEAYYARTCPQERDTISKALATLSIRGEKRVERSAASVYLDEMFKDKNNDVLLAEVHKLYEATSPLYHEFRQVVHRPLKMMALVDIALKCNLTDISLSLRDTVVSTEPTVAIPKHLAVTPSLGLRHGRSPPTGSRDAYSPRRRVVAATANAVVEKRLSRKEVLDQLGFVAESDQKLLHRWEFYDLSANNAQVFDPIALEPLLSVRFETVWRGLQMPTTRRFDLALKYSQPEFAHRLADAVALWELCAHWIAERESTMEAIKKLLKAGDAGAPGVAHSLYDLMLVLLSATKKTKQSIALTHDHVDDFVTYEDDFYLNRVVAQHQQLA